MSVLPEAPVVSGRVVRFESSRGYGFIAPDSGGEDVFMHVKEISAEDATIACGTRVEFRVVDGVRGQKAYDVRVLGGERDLPEAGVPASPPVVRTSPAVGRAPVEGEETCEVLSLDDFSHKVTELIILSAPTVNGEEIVRIRTALTKLAREYGWLE